MKLYGVRIFVDDFQAARAFYTETLGLHINWDSPEHGAMGVSVGSPELIIEATSAGSPDRALVGRFVGVSLQVDDIHAAHAALVDKSVVFTGPPEQQSWGGWLAHFKDPAGNTLTLLG